ncbi:MAG TPA: acetate kinase, partial [Bryobacteraceae bacterium]|nr:acetate kinase [Bryobacteraceae bacterium]
VDPSLASVIAAKEALSADDVDEMLNTGSGLLGISGVSSDMRELQREAQLGHARAQLAIDVFCYRARKYIGAFLAAMGGTDAVIFTGGIGENSPEIRAKICEGLAWTGLRLDTERNGKTRGVEGRIGTDESTLPAFCIPTDEELLIARDTVRCILGVPHPG